MKRLALLVFTCSVMFAQTQSIFSKYEEEFKNAVSSYKAMEYTKALGTFEELSSLTPENPEVHFYTGLCLLELKQYDQALGAFDRVLMLAPNHTRTHLEIARVYYETKAYVLANAQLDIALKDNIPQSVKTTIMRFKKNIDEQMTKHYFSGAISVGFSYDSNANNDIGNIQFVVPSFSVTVAGNEEKSDTSLSLSTYLSHRYDVGEKGDWFIDSRVLLYGKLNREFTKNNLSLWSISTAPSYYQDRVKIALPLSFDNVYLAGENYVKIWQFGVEGTYLIDNKSNLSTALKMKRSMYANENLDAKSKLVEIKYKRAFGNQPIYATMGVTYESNSRVNGARTDVAGDSLSYKVELSKELNTHFVASLGYTYALKKFDDVDLSFLTKREDTQNKYDAALTYKFKKDMFIQTTLSYLSQNSNHAPFEYDKTVVGMNFIKNF